MLRKNSGTEVPLKAKECVCKPTWLTSTLFGSRFKVKKERPLRELCFSHGSGASVFEVVNWRLRWGAMSSSVPGPQVAGSSAGSGLAAQDVPALYYLKKSLTSLVPPDDQNLCWWSSKCCAKPCCCESGCTSAWGKLPWVLTRTWW